MLCGHGPITMRFGHTAAVSQRGEGLQIALDEVVVPAAERKHRHVHLSICSRVLTAFQ